MMTSNEVFVTALQPGHVAEVGREVELAHGPTVTALAGKHEVPHLVQFGDDAELLEAPWEVGERVKAGPLDSALYQLVEGLGSEAPGDGPVAGRHEPEDRAGADGGELGPGWPNGQDDELWFGALLVGPGVQDGDH